MCFVADPNSFDMMFLDISKKNSAAQINPFARFQFCNRYIVEIVQNYP